jgi:excisionase family DNA binding protein
MAQLSLGQAAKLTGLGKTTLARAIKAGRLSATRRDDGGYQIEVSELERVYPLRPPADATPATGDETGPVVHHATIDVDLVTEVAALRATAALMREQLAEVREDRDRWRVVAERLTLAPPRPPETPAGAGDAPTPSQDPVTESAGARLRNFLFESDPVWRWWRRSA